MNGLENCGPIHRRGANAGFDAVPDHVHGANFRVDRDWVAG